MKSILLAFLLLPVHSFTIIAQDPVSVPDKPGTWTYAYLNDENTKMYARQFGMTPEEITLFRQKLDQIVEVLHRNPIMSDPKGVDPSCGIEAPVPAWI